MTDLPPSPLPPTIIVVHPREKRSKCSVEPLRGRPEFLFWKFPNRGPQPLTSYVRLGLGGPLLSPADSPHGLLLLDGTWRLAAKMEQSYSQLPVRSLLPWQTAYPRVSKYDTDPAAGLATIEALYAALTQMGRPTDGLLDDYRWGKEFVEKNAGLVERCLNGIL
ncbi:DTW domain-containing protein [Planctomicrobium piriforme]|uniref:Pre-rRNA-processing protein TSR3 n=1 Tax=Planctomicrobium piriforme TaxID=1576369 RepID=A0A1I3B7Q8_9PLAN|nr:DTW domain-containing protein [Planctomicrobium piriforme]SFH58314.1 pre-rRNA-processing protein TSR3 [Planctomicrobium piriforme]